MKHSFFAAFGAVAVVINLAMWAAGAAPGRIWALILAGTLLVAAF